MDEFDFFPTWLVIAVVIVISGLAGLALLFAR